MPITTEQRREIRKAYELLKEDIESGEYVSPYAIGIDWITMFSPIEENVWASIRYLGIPLFPQYPVGPFFIDFADPFRKIGIEVDSVRWHKDSVKDRKRQDEIEKLGWRIFRIDSYMTFKNREDFEGDGGKVDWDAYVEGSAEGFLHDLYYEFLIERQMGGEKKGRLKNLVGSM